MAKDEAVQAILDEAGKALEAYGVQYLIGVVDRQPTAEDGGKVHTQSNVTPENLPFILDAVAISSEFWVKIGHWVGLALHKSSKSKDHA